MKIKYPIEAFALAMLIFSQTVSMSIVTGILILVLTVSGVVIQQLTVGLESKLIRVLILWISIVSLSYASFLLVFLRVLQMETTNEFILLQVILGLLIAKHLSKTETIKQLNTVIYESIIAYASLIIIGLIREFCSVGSIMGYTIGDFTFMTKNFQTIIAGFILSGIGVSFTNFIIKKGITSINSLWVILPVILLYRPFSLDNTNNVVSFLIGVIIPLIFLISVQKRLTFSCLSRAVERLPIELVSTGFIYMILKVF